MVYFILYIANLLGTVLSKKKKERQHMNKNIKLKGKLWVLFSWPVILAVLLVFFNIVAYIYDVKSGVIFSGFVPYNTNE